MNTVLNKNLVIVNDEKLASKLYNKGRYGTPRKKKLELSLVEALFLIDNDKIRVFDNKNNELSRQAYVNKAVRQDSRFTIRYAVYKDMRTKGYLLKTALKYGLDYRVYPKGKKPEKSHAEWLLHCVHENQKYGWKDFAGIMRVVNSVRKKLLVGIVDDEGDVTYYEVVWKKN